MHILQMIEEGQISAADGLRRLNELAGAEEKVTVIPGPSTASAGKRQPLPPNLERWKQWWLLPVWLGVGITTLSALWMYQAYQAGGFGFWFACAWMPFTVGVLVIAAAAASRSAKWIHIRVKTGQREWPQNIALSFPLPIRLTAWFLRTFGHTIPRLKDTGVDELILALADSASPQTPLYVEVDEGGNGERVQVYIG
jgi:hypothetical protein